MLPNDESPRSDSEHTRLAEAGADSRPALEQLQSFNPCIWKVLRKQFPSFNESDIEDVIQTAMSKAIKKIAQCRTTTTDGFRGWLFTIARHEAIRLATKNRNGRYTNIPAGQHAIVDPGSGPQKPLERAEKAKKIQAALDQLGERQRTIITLKFFEDADYPLICEIMKISYDAARALLARALRELRSQFGENT
jgi:RNA polymerase sigma factor (sigma-70 family)